MANKALVPERLRSRKLWVVILTGVFAAVTKGFDLELDPEMLDLLTFTIASYLVGQSAVDYSKSKENASKYAAWMATQMSQPVRYPDDSGEYTG